jgi:hypothetical protein
MAIGKGGGFGRGAQRGLGGGIGLGPGGECVCPICNYHQNHKLGIACNKIKCPKCGATLRRA